MTSEAYIFDSIRSPRGKRKNGSLNEITPTDLLSKLMCSNVRKRYSAEDALNHQWLQKTDSEE